MCIVSGKFDHGTSVQIAQHDLLGKSAARFGPCFISSPIQFRFVRHPGLIPRRIENKIYLDLPNGRDVADGLLHPAQHFTATGQRRRERHVDFDRPGSFSSIR